MSNSAVALAQTDLTEFCCLVDPMVAEKYRAAHLAHFAGYLQRAERRDITKLVVSMPVRHWKSSLGTEKFAAWYLGRHPDHSIILLCHSAELAETFSQNIRALIQSPEYQGIFPGITLRADTKALNKWALSDAYRTTMVALGVGGSPTGVGADCIIIDDPTSGWTQARSQTSRDTLWNTYRGTIRTRLQPDGIMLVTASRWTRDDLTGRLLKDQDDRADGDKWTVLHLPAIAGDDDPLGRAPGQALWESEWSHDTLMAIKADIGNHAFSALYQGDPVPDEGNILDSTLLVMLDAPPDKLVKQVRRWDLAFSDRKGADFVAGTLAGITADRRCHISHVLRMQGGWTQTKPAIISQALNDGNQVTCAIEANGTQLGYFQDIKNDPRMRGIRVVPDIPRGTKEARADIWGSRLPDGIISCSRGAWNKAFFDEMDTFPYGDHDDMIDAMSGAWGVLYDIDRALHTF